MKPEPHVSIVLPVFNDEASVAATLESCLAQTLDAIEVICVDDASTDGTVAVIERFSARDDRVRLIRHDRNMSAFQSRRTGILAARAPYVLFVDGDDELVPDAAQKALSHAQESGADLTAFGVTVIEKDGRTGGAYEARLQPKHTTLQGSEVLAGLFPVGKQAQGQLWRFLFRTEILRDAYGLLPQDLSLPRVNDLPLLFLVAALSESYSSIPDKLYRYHFGRGGSGHSVDSVERAEFYVSAVTSIDSIRSAVSSIANTHSHPEAIIASYDSARLSIIGYVCFQLVERGDPAVLGSALSRLRELASEADILRAASRFYPATLTALSRRATRLGFDEQEVSSILLATSTVRTGGVSAVIASQARYLLDAGYRVTVVARNGGSDVSVLPEGTEFVELTGRTATARLQEWGEVCRERDVDVVIDHQILYTPHWPEYALAARGEGAATVGWVHNFVGRPVYDGTDRLSLIESCAAALAQLVVLSPLDVAYFKLRGVSHVAFVPNPPSPLLLEASETAVVKPAPSGRIELLWWGRLEQHTKRVYELIEVGAELSRNGLDYRLRVIGPDWDDVTAAKFNALSRRRGVGDRVVAEGPLRGAQLLDAVDAAHAFVTTSIIEGYQLTIAEAQSRGLPVFMYELPWLTLVQDNAGVVSVPQGDASLLAREIVKAMADPDRYEFLSRASVDAAHRATSYDFAALYRGVVTGALPAEFSPEPTLDEASQLLGLMTFFAERSRRSGRSTRARAHGLGARVWNSAAPVGREALKRVPGLRPLAHRAKRWLGLG